jgi:hemoglobin/transferrin/lactoferrin receptor protein
LAGTVNLVTRTPALGTECVEFQGEFNPTFSSADRGFGTNLLLSYGSRRFGGYVNLAARRVNTLRTADGLDTHSAVTRFLGLPSRVFYDRNPDTAFTQFGGAVRMNFAPRDDQQIAFFYQRSQQDGGKRSDQLIGGDGNLIADLRNLMLDFGYLRYVKQGMGWFDTGSATASYNSQREERVNQGGQGNPFGDITHQYERTSVFGFSLFLDKQLGSRNTFLVGGDVYLERFRSPAFTVDPAANMSLMSRPRIPDGARFDSAGFFIQDTWDAIPERLRITGAVRYSGVNYRVRASDSPLVNGQRLWSDDEISTADFSGRIGAVVRATKNLRVALNYGRGFRYPSMTDLGTLGLTGDGFEVDHRTSGALGGMIGTTAGADAVSTGQPVQKQRSEISHNFDLSLRYENRRFDTELTVFRLDIVDGVTKQALILPPGAVGQFLADQQITTQLPSGVVFVAASTAPVLVRSNFTSARTYGVEYEAEGRLTDSIRFRGNFTYIRAEEKETGLPPNIEGGTPPPTGFVSIRWLRPRYWIEAYSTLAAKQDRLSSLDLSDRRTGAARSRAQIANFIRRGACIRGLTVNQNGTGCATTAGNPTYILLATGETLAQVQDRLLPNIGDNVAVPMLTYLPGYGTLNLRGSFTLSEKTRLNWAFENILDQAYRNPSWGIDGPGRSITLQIRYKF